MSQYDPNQYNPNVYQGENQPPPPQPSEFEVQGANLVGKVKELVHEGNVREITITHEGNTILRIPLTVGVIGTLVAPQLAALGAIGALLTHCTIQVVRSDRP